MTEREQRRLRFCSKSNRLVGTALFPPSVLPVIPVFAIVASLVFGACAPHHLRPPQPDPGVPPATVRVEPAQVWTDSGLSVRKGEALIFTATGQVHWSARGEDSGPDGLGGWVGWKVGRDGLIGRVGEAGKVFDIGARTEPYHDYHPRPPHHLHFPAAIRMAADGKLFLGFKDFQPGSNSGSYEVTIRRAAKE